LEKIEQRKKPHKKMVLREPFSEKRDFLGKYHRKIKNENESKKGTRRNILL